MSVKIRAPKNRLGRQARYAAALGIGSWLLLSAALLHAQTAERDPRPSLELPRPPGPAPAAARRTFTDAVFADATAVFIPYANDLLLMIGAGVRIAGIHELWARAGYIALGDDTRYGIGSGGYRVALRPQRMVRPVLGALVAGEAATCDHDASGHPVCTPTALFILAGTAGVRIEPVPWLGLATAVALGTDSYPHPFAMLELGVSIALPQTELRETARAKAH